MTPKLRLDIAAAALKDGAVDAAGHVQEGVGGADQEVHSFVQDVALLDCNFHRTTDGPQFSIL
jgi:hypothetical protein